VTRKTPVTADYSLCRKRKSHREFL